MRGLEIPSLTAANIEDRIAAFVRDLLYEADGMRWLSLASLLPCSGLDVASFRRLRTTTAPLYVDPGRDQIGRMQGHIEQCLEAWWFCVLITCWETHPRRGSMLALVSIEEQSKVFRVCSRFPEKEIRDTGWSIAAVWRRISPMLSGSRWPTIALPTCSLTCWTMPKGPDVPC